MDIRILPQDLVNQIAAGEVVERPSHMVKELVENSIDAGATELEIDFAQGGKYLSIKDNGHGIKKDQLAVALARHATSKINKIDDLWQLSSFGFRGEALASISAVSDFTMNSKNAGEEDSYELRCEFGKILPLKKSHKEQGTHIIIKDLFKNVPARLKFLKTDGYEGTQIKNVLKAMAMSHPQVSFRVKLAGELIFYWPSTDSRKKRVEDILGIQDMHHISGELDGAKVELIYSSPNKTAKSRRQIWSFVQERWVQDSTVSSAIVDAYRTLLMHGEYPYAVCYVHMDPEDLDVNIHPTKSQVKFRNSSHVYKLVYRHLRADLEKAPWLKHLLPDNNENAENEELTLKMKPLKAPKETNIAFSDSSFLKTHFKKKDMLDKQTSAPTVADLKTLAMDNVRENLTNAVVEESKVESQKMMTKLSQNINSDHLNTTNHQGVVTSNQKWSQLQVLGQLNLTYIVTQNEKSLILVDQHAAHERVVFERLMLQFEQQNFEVQNLLIPHVVKLREDLVQVLLTNQDEVAKLGIEMDALGEDAIAVRAHPSFIKEKSIGQALEKMALQIEKSGGSVELKNRIADVFATMACHSVVRAGQSLSQEEMENLLVQMDEFPLSSFCPHGRPVFVERPFSQIEKDFGRLV